MSGFVAVVRLDGAPADPALVARLAERLAFRGPDGIETTAAGSAALGCALLRMEPGERQLAEKNGVWIAADARLDDRAALIDALRAAGLAARAESTDAELILLAWEAWGERAPEHLLGDWSFALWDPDRRTLFCACDALGVRPLFYARTRDSLVVSNTLDAVRAHPDVSSELNEQAVDDFLLHGMNLEADTTFFAAVRRLPGGHRLTCRDGGIRIGRWWSLPLDGRVRCRRAAEYAEHYAALLDAAVADRLRTNRAAIFLSGGVDSTSVAAAARDVLERRGGDWEMHAHTTVSAGLIEEREGELAAEVAAALGIAHHPLVVDGYRPYDGWDLPRLHTPEPYDNPLGIIFSDQLLAASAHSRLVLGGEGGDLLFVPSYGHFRRLLRRGHVATFARDAWTHLRVLRAPPPMGVSTAISRLRRLGRKASADAVDAPPWIRPEVVRRAREREAERARAEAAWTLHPVRPEAHARLLSPYWPYVFSVYDPGTTRLPVRVALPLFDLRLVNYVFAIPPVPWLPRKHLAREAMRGRLPESVRARPKTPVPVWPLLAHLQRYGADFGGALADAPGLERFVDPARVPAIAQPGQPLDAYRSIADTRAVSLARWLRQIHRS